MSSPEEAPQAADRPPNWSALWVVAFIVGLLIAIGLIFLLL
jgi:capsular polysaccharide biosynthesis protein